MGLITAVDRFDASRGFSFLTYADHWIRQSIIRNIIDTAYMIRLPVHVIDRVRRFWGVRAAHPDFSEADLVKELLALGYAVSEKEIRYDRRELIRIFDEAMSMFNLRAGRKMFFVLHYPSFLDLVHVFQQNPSEVFK